MTHEQRAAALIDGLESEYSVGEYLVIKRAELEDAIARGMAEASKAVAYTRRVARVAWNQHRREHELRLAVDWTGQVEAFMRAGGQEIPERPRFPGWYVERLRVRLIKEELEEIKEALGSCDITEVADGVIDLLYVVIGMGLAFGLPMRELFAEVHRSNMAKAGPDGKFQMRADGKITKPEGWQGPRIAEILRHHGAAVEAPR